MSRVAGWEMRLADAVRRGLETPFQWGVHDCTTFAFDVRSALLGGAADVPWRGKYRTAEGAARYLRKLGHADLEAAARAVLGDPLDTVLMAQRGDIALAGQPEGAWVVIGRDVVGVGPDGPAVLPLRACRLVWRV